MSVELPGAVRRDPVIAGVRFALYRAEPGGDAGKPPALLLHGVPETAHMWRRVLPDLARDRLVLAPDLKGFGDSEARGPYDITTLVREIAALIRDQAGGQQVDVVGHDWGGTLAAVLSARNPELVRRLVVCNAPYRHVDYLRAWHMLLFSAPALPKALLQLGGRRAVELMMRAGWRAETPPEPEIVEHYAAAYAPPERVEAMLAYYRTATRPRLMRAARRLAQPVLPVRGRPEPSAESGPVAPRGPSQPALVVWGARDPVLPLSVGQAAVRDLGPRTEMITIPGAGHFVVEEAPETVLPAVRGFLDGSDQTAGS